MYPNIDNSAVNNEIIKNFDMAVDLVYNPTKTKFLQIAIGEGKDCYRWIAYASWSSG